MKIVFASLIPSTNNDNTVFIRPNIPAGYISSYLLKYRDDNIKIMDPNDAITSNIENVANKILKFNPDMIGFSIYVWNRTETKSVINYLRTIGFRGKIVIGGPEVAYNPIDALHDYSVDWVCNTEGEKPFLALLNMLQKNNNFNVSIPGMVSKTDGKIYNAENQLIKNLDDIPSPYLTGLLDPSDKNWMDLETMRGCPFSCGFCLYSKNTGSMRYHSSKRVEEDVNYAIKSGINRVYLMDPTFNMPRNRCLQLCDRISEINNRQSLVFSTEAYAEYIDEYIADAFVRANIRFIEIGLQSTNPITLKYINRQFNKEKFLNGCHNLRDRNIFSSIGIIIGLPGDRPDDIRKTVDFVISNKLGYLSIYKLQILPGTLIHFKAKEFKLSYDKLNNYHIKNSPLLKEGMVEELYYDLTEQCKQYNEEYSNNILKTIPYEIDDQKLFYKNSTVPELGKSLKKNFDNIPELGKSLKKNLYIPSEVGKSLKKSVQQASLA
ncbi:Fe-S oxidoreductase [Candidatus Magnetomorum sp. HK-1]|nr:Fe-S oxidoreductase [Candidatus Magnetomorum sp. HK-1]